ncbi:MAG: YggT family protein [Candidatus Sericytochromatia bacterium]
MMVISVLESLRWIIWVLIFGRMIVSFLPQMDASHPIVRFLYTATEPILAPFRAILPTTRIGIDFSPMLALFVIDIVFRLLVQAVAGV